MHSLALEYGNFTRTYLTYNAFLYNNQTYNPFKMRFAAASTLPCAFSKKFRALAGVNPNMSIIICISSFFMSVEMKK